VSRQEYYQWESRQETMHEIEKRLVEAVRGARAREPKVGGRKLYVKLSALIPFGRDWFFRFLKRFGLLVRIKRKPPVTTCATEAKTPNLLAGKEKPERAGAVLVSDFTYLRRIEGHYYLALVTDLCSRRIIGYHLSKRATAEMCIVALRRALGVIAGRRKRIIHHSDRGKQYTGGAYTDVLRHHRIRISTTQKMHCAENAVAERVNGILKGELMLNATFATFRQAQRAVKEAITIYNTERLHTALAYETPEAYFNRHI